MSEMSLDSDQLKAVLKSAIVELLHENRQEISDLLAEIIEDIAMERAIGEGETTKHSDFHQSLLSSGLVKQIKKPQYRQINPQQLIQVQGKSLSETIVKERR
jgi:hypothetical protein